MSDKIREEFKAAADAVGIKDGADRLALWGWWLKAWQAALAQQPAPAVPDDLRVRCIEILAWHKTGVLKGDALRDYAEAQWYASEHNSLQMAETDTAREAFKLLATPAAPVAQEPVDNDAFAVALAEKVIAYIDGAARIGKDWRLGLAGMIARRTSRLTAPPAAEQPDHWTPSSGDYDRSIHCNPDAKAWADFFVATFPALANKHDLMLGWFANAMMAMHDWMKSQPTEQPDAEGMPLLHWYAMSFRDSGPSGEPVTASTNIGWPDQLITLPRIQEAKKGALVSQNAVMLACCYLGHATRSQILGKEGEA